MREVEQIRGLGQRDPGHVVSSSVVPVKPVHEVKFLGRPQGSPEVDKEGPNEAQGDEWAD